MKNSKRKGNNKITVLFQNPNSKNSAKFKAALPEIANNSIIFLSETMTLEKKQKSLFEHKLFEYVNAFKGDQGRPKGGLDMYCSQVLKPTVLSKSEKHIAIKISNLTIIGVYFEPEMEFEDITTLLTAILDLTYIDNDEAILIGGDFNIKPHEQEFEELTTFLSTYQIGVATNIDEPTYEKNGNKSTIDYVFANKKVELIETKTINLLNSDHYTTTVKIKIPAIAYISENSFKDSPKTRISLVNVM